MEIGGSSIRNGGAAVLGVRTAAPGPSLSPGRSDRSDRRLAVGYRFGFNRLGLLAESSSDGERSVRLNGLIFETDGPGGDVRLVTDLEVREGHQAVVGKASSGCETDESLIVVVEVRVVD